MKRLVVVFAIFMCALCLYAQNNASRNRGVIRVEQCFHGWTHCHWDDEPTFGECTIKSAAFKAPIELTSSKSIDTIAIEQMFVSGNRVVYIDREKTIKLSLDIVHDASHIDDDVSDYNMKTLLVGYNSFAPKEKESDCIGSKNEGYDVRTNVIVDNPVEIIPKKDNSSLCIDNGDKCEFSLNDFYVTKDTEFKLSIKLTSEDDNCWREDVRTFKPNQEIALSYEEILSIAGITDKFAWSGKNISIKITKKLIDGSWSESNVVLCTFIHKGPDFEIETVRRTNCSYKVELIVKSERLGTYPEDKFKWAVMQKDSINAPDNTAFCPQNIKQFEQTSTPNVYKLTVEDNEFFSRSIIEHPDKLKPWFLQLQNIYNPQDSSVAFFTTKEFEIAPRAPQIKIEQYTNAGIEVESGLDPYIRIKIEDLDTYYDNGRVPYKVYEVYDENEENKEEYLTEFNNRIDATKYNETQLKSKFESRYPQYKLDITESSYIQNKFHEWYENEKNGPAVKTIKVSGSLPNESQSGAGKVTESANVMCDNDGSTLYFYGSLDGKSIWNKIEFSSTKYPIGTTKKEATKINNSNYSIPIPANTYVPGYTKDYITQGSNFIVFSASNNYIHAIFFDGSSKIKHIVSDYGDNASSYVARIIWGQPCLLHCKNKSTILTCYINGKSTQFRLYESPNAVGATSISSDSIVEYFSGNQKYEHHNTPFSESDLYEYFKKDKAVIPSTHFDAAWKEFREKRNALYAQFLAERLSYRVSGMKHYKTKSQNGDMVTYIGKLKIQDVDGCFSNELKYTFQYSKVKFKSEVSTYPSKLYANDGVVKLTLDKGGLTPYTVNGSSLNIGDVVEVSGCGYGVQYASVTDKNGKTFKYEFDVPIPYHTVECKPQACSGNGGEIVVRCDNNEIKLNGYFVKRNGNVYQRINSTSNSDTYRFAELDLGDYEVYGEFDNGDPILLSEKETIVDKSFSVTAVVDNATKIEGKGTIKLTTQNAQGDVYWKEITKNDEVEIGEKVSSISIKDVSIGRHEYRVSDSQDCTITKNVEVSGPEISMNVDIEANEKSAYIKIEDIKPQNISNYHSK